MVTSINMICQNFFLIDVDLFSPWAMRKMMRRQFDSMAAKLASPLPSSVCSLPPASSNQWPNQSPRSSRSFHTGDSGGGGQGRVGWRLGVSRQVGAVLERAGPLTTTPPSLTHNPLQSSYRPLLLGERCTLPQSSFPHPEAHSHPDAWPEKERWQRCLLVVVVVV